MKKPVDWRFIAAIAAASIIFAVLAFAFAFGRCSAPDPAPHIIVMEDIDAGPGELVIEARLDAAIQSEDARLRALEEARRAELLAFNEHDLLEYAEMKRAGRERLAAWLAERSRRLLGDGGLR